MNLIEAVRSGKPFKRKGSDRFRSLGQSRREDILADDWEIQEEKIEITREQLRVALLTTNEEAGSLDECYFMLCSLLGFKND